MTKHFQQSLHTKSQNQQICQSHQMHLTRLTNFSSFIRGDDINRLADDAIASDGLGNFLSSYDGNYDELPDGKIIARIN